MFSELVHLIISEEVSTRAQRASSPTYPGVPQAVAITSPVPSIFDKPKSLIMIFDSSWGLKYSRFSGWKSEERVKQCACACLSVCLCSLWDIRQNMTQNLLDLSFKSWGSFTAHPRGFVSLVRRKIPNIQPLWVILIKRSRNITHTGQGFPLSVRLKSSLQQQMQWILWRTVFDYESYCTFRSLCTMPMECR